MSRSANREIADLQTRCDRLEKILKIATGLESIEAVEVAEAARARPGKPRLDPDALDDVEEKKPDAGRQTPTP